VRRVHLFLILCLAAALVPFLRGGSSGPAPTSSFPGWPPALDETPLVPLPLCEVDRRFTESFPGRIGKFTDGRREILIRWVPGATRKLHPASDCFRGMGYRVEPRPVMADALGRRWGSFAAARGGERAVVFERIYGGEGNQWSDVSAWYWSALLGRTSGPYWAVTLIERM